MTMREKSAVERGYHFTGIYNFAKEDSQNRLDDIRADGYKAVLVFSPASKYSRGCSGGGYSVYAEQRYFDDKRREDLVRRDEQFGGRKQMLLKEFRERLKELKEEEKTVKEEIDKLSSKRK